MRKKMMDAPCNIGTPFGRLFKGDYLKNWFAWKNFTVGANIVRPRLLRQACGLPPPLQRRLCRIVSSHRGDARQGRGVFSLPWKGRCQRSWQRDSQRISLLFFFTEKKKRSKKRKAYCLPFYKKAMYHTTGSVMRLDYAQQKSPGGVTGGCCRRNTALFER